MRTSLRKPQWIGYAVGVLSIGIVNRDTQVTGPAHKHDNGRAGAAIERVIHSNSMGKRSWSFRFAPCDVVFQLLLPATFRHVDILPHRITGSLCRLSW